MQKKEEETVEILQCFLVIRYSEACPLSHSCTLVRACVPLRAFACFCVLVWFFLLARYQRLLEGSLAADQGAAAQARSVLMCDLAVALVPVLDAPSVGLLCVGRSHKPQRSAGC